MAGKIMLLDCTLRDGGYINDWKFGNGTMNCIFDRLNESGVEMIEIGFMDERRPVDKDRTIQPDARSLSNAYCNISDRRSMVTAMIDYGTCTIKNVQPAAETQIDGIRVIFKKENMYNAVKFGKDIMKKGYKLFLQMVSVTSYDDNDVLDFVKEVNRICPFAVSIVDTYGLMHKEHVFRYFELLDSNLDPSIAIGYHSHNNFQLAYSNTIEMLKKDTERDMIVDGTLYGMGKSAGNAPIELLSMHLNDNYGKNYDVSQILETIDVNIMPMYEKRYWGYGFEFYLSAKNDCHPNYVSHLKSKRTLSVKAVDDIISSIPSEDRLSFNDQLIERLYAEYLENVDDSASLEAFSKALGSSEVLLIGPGRSATEESENIREHLENRNSTVIGVNYVPSLFDADFVFFGSSKRYGQMVPALKNSKAKIIATSNITPIKRPFDHVMEYGKLISERDELWDNTLIIILNLLKKVNVDVVYLAGFDGFREKAEKNYVDGSFDLSKTFNYLSIVNRLLAKKIKEYRKDLEIVFLTSSMYEDQI
jgi:Isopropylmalate/homocitrate/citramalate synthases